MNRYQRCRLCGYAVTDSCSDMHPGCKQVYEEEAYLTDYVNKDEDTGELASSGSSWTMMIEDLSQVNIFLFFDIEGEGGVWSKVVVEAV